jgi:hypothetical protein
MDAMRVLCFGEKILLNTFTARMFYTIFAGYTLPYNWCILLNANGTIYFDGYYYGV